jgi:hypothetical protein
MILGFFLLYIMCVFISSLMYKYIYQSDNGTKDEEKWIYCLKTFCVIHVICFAFIGMIFLIFYYFF